MSLSAPPAIYTPPSAGSPPAAPGAVHAVPSPSPAAPGAVHVVPVVGGGSSSIAISGTLEDGGTAAEFGTLYETGMQNGKPKYISTDRSPDYLNATLSWELSSFYIFEPSEPGWVLFHQWPDMVWISRDDVATPDLIVNWEAYPTATGTPVITLIPGGGSLPTPPAIHAAPSSSPGAPPAIFSPP